MTTRKRLTRRLVTLAACVGLALTAAASAEAATPPAQDPFYKYTGSTPLANIAPGTVLKTRTLPYHIVGLPVALKTTQLLYRSTGSLGQPTTNVTSVVQPLFTLSRRVVSYQSAYDSLNQNDEPSYQIAGGVTLGGLLSQVETAVLAPFLTLGYSVVVSDTEGQPANFAAGREYGMNTLDSLRAAMKSPSTGLNSSFTRIAMLGYSGGAIATEWAAELAPTYAPDVNSRLVGSAMGGVLVHPAHNLHYVEGTPIWAGVMPMALIGIARAYDIDLSPYLTPYGAQVYERMKDDSIAQVLGAYPGLKWSDLAKPQYPTPESIPAYVTTANKLIMGTGGTPTKPLFIGQGANGELEGTPGDKPGIGAGDGVMIAGDVRSLARKYCSKGVKVKYEQYNLLSHVTSLVTWLPAAIDWVNDRFNGLPAPQNCSSIAPGNSLDPIPAT